MNRFKQYISMIINKLTNKSSAQSPIKESKTEVAEVPKKKDTESIRLMSVSQAAGKRNVSRQAIFYAIKMNRLKARKENGCWLISDQDLQIFVDSKFSRSISKKDGELIFDKNKGHYSVSEVAKMLKKPRHQVYYFVRLGSLKSHRLGGNIIIKDEDIKTFIKDKHKIRRRKIAM